MTSRCAPPTKVRTSPSRPSTSSISSPLLELDDDRRVALAIVAAGQQEVDAPVGVGDLELDRDAAAVGNLGALSTLYMYSMELRQAMTSRGLGRWRRCSKAVGDVLDDRVVDDVVDELGLGGLVDEHRGSLVPDANWLGQG